MKFLSNLFNLTKKAKLIPDSWCGKWIDKKGKQLIIKATAHDFYNVTVLDSNLKPFDIELLGGNIKKTTDLIARYTKDQRNIPILQVEAGSDGIGPTYDLYFLKLNDYDKPRTARKSDNIYELIIKPNVGIGLYDDWEDDLGVHWAFPLEYLKKM